MARRTYTIHIQWHAVVYVFLRLRANIKNYNKINLGGAYTFRKKLIRYEFGFEYFFSLRAPPYTHLKILQILLYFFIYVEMQTLF